jgi:beta-glucosidase
VGPTAANVNAMLGNYAGISARVVTVAEGIAERVHGATIFEYRAGCALSEQTPPGLNYTFGAAAATDVVVAVMGLDPTLEGEEGDAVASQVGGDRAALELPAVQREFLRELRRHAKKLVLVLTGGSAIAVPEEHEFCDAVLHAWYPGCEGGHAIADVLFGNVSPSGKLPVTVPRRTEDLPAFNDYRMNGRTYRFAAVEPLYPFGFGLGYATLTYHGLRASATSLHEGYELSLRAMIRNASDRATLETVQCYVVPPPDWPEAPRAVLVAFEKTEIPAHGEARVTFMLSADCFRQVDVAGQRVWVRGKYRVIVGSASPGPRAVALGAPAPAEIEVELV